MILLKQLKNLTKEWLNNMVKKDLDYKFLFNRLLDDLCEVHRLSDVCSKLLFLGLKKEDLIGFGFDENDIDAGKEIVNEVETNA